MKPEMKWALAILLSLMALFGTAQVLNQKVNLDARNITVDEALQQINRTYGIKFSYANNLLPSTKLNLQLKDTPLSQVLDKVLAGSGLTYQQVGDQIVIKKAAVKKTTPAKPAPSKPQTGYNTDSLQHSEPVASADIEVIPQVPQPNLPNASTYESEEDLDEAYRAERHRMRRDYEQKIDSIKTAEGRRTFKQKWKTSMVKLHLEYREAKDSLSTSWKGFKERRIEEFKATQDTLRHRKELKDSLGAGYNYYHESTLQDTIPADTNAAVQNSDSSSAHHLKRDKFQISLLPHIGTHGDEATEYMNDFSVNVFGGYNGGSKYVEAGLLVNVTKYYITGVQFAGIANVVEEDMKGLQFAIINVVGDQVQGVQFSSIASISEEDVWGGQYSGIVSIAGDTLNGAQASGIVSYAPHYVYGVQLAGIANVCGQGIHGAQIGFINSARYVNGVQIGFINAADSVKGVPIGFLSFVKNGYHHPELYYGETMTTNIAFKTGVRPFYNILYAGYQWESNGYYRWSYGYGLGSEIKLGKRVAMNMDVIGMQVNENEGFTDVPNFLGQFRMLFGVGLSKTIYLFAGPTFNTMLSQYQQSDGTLGSALIPNKNLIWETDYMSGGGKPTKAAMWIGFNAGIRF